jgi:branched-subunit amino acid ABC-type transport system permease component
MSAVLQNGLADSAIYILLATSFFLIFSVSKVLHFAHGTGFLLGAYVGYSVQQDAPFIVALISALVVGAVFGYLTERVLYEPLRARGATNMILLIASLALFILGENLVGMVYGSSAITLESAPQDALVGVGGIQFSGVQVIGMLGAIVWVALVVWVLTRTSVGFYIRAIATHQSLADLTGVPSARVRQLVFLGASAAVGFAGVVQAADTSADPGIGMTGTLFAVVPFIIGGSRSVWGAVLGGAIIGLGTNASARYLGAEWTEVFLFAVLALIILMRPEGLIMARSR